MADFKLRASPRLRFLGAFSVDGVIGVGGLTQLAGSATARAVGQAALLRGVNLAGSAAASSQAVAALLKGLRLSAAGVSGAVGGGALSAVGGTWAPASISLLVGASGLPAGQFNMTGSGPSGYVSGGAYSVDPAGTQLPGGMTLTEAGVLDVGTAAQATTNGVLFSYGEPGAFADLTLHPTATGTLPYMATWYPLEGVVPSGYNVFSPDDANLRGSIISAWPDGSAQVIVLAGETAVSNGVTKGIRLRTGQPAAGTALTTARIAAVVSSVAVNFGGGVQTLNSFSSPDRVWWANARVICARYRLSCNVGVMEAIIDIHAFAAGVSDRAFVEVVIENGKVDTTTPVAPSPQTYTNATVSVNGTQIQGGAGVNSSHTVYYYDGITTFQYQPTTETAHPAFRAWYCSGWVGGDPGIEVVHDTASMQWHPWFWKQMTALTADMQARWSGKTYTPWSTVDLPAYNMGGTGGQQWIGMLTMAESDYLCTGKRYARQAVLANALGLLSYDYNTRNQSTGLVVSPTDINGRNIGYLANWPREPNRTVNGNTAYPEPAFEEAHQPPGALMAFMCRPSPVFIEVAQKVFAWNVFRWGERRQYSQVRGRAWRFRNLGQGIYLTPDNVASGTNYSAWKSSARALLAANSNDIFAFRDSPWNKLGFVWNGLADAYENDMTTRLKGQDYIWQSYWLIRAAHHIDKAKILSGIEGASWKTMADWLAELPCRYINEPASGEWRLIDVYGDDVSTTDPPTMTQPDTWAGAWTINMTGTPPAASGSILSRPSTTTYTWSAVNNWSGTIGDNYPAYFLAGLSAAVEREVPGALTAWSKFTTQITSYSAFTASAADGRNNTKPRNV